MTVYAQYLAAEQKTIYDDPFNMGLWRRLFINLNTVIHN